jgi:DNA segregation ATPase FtsK/SpoIIIE-like protein
VSKAPHILISGTTGSGKTVFLYSMIVSLISKHSKDNLEIVVVDPKQTDFHFFKGLPHLRGNKIITDPEEALKMLDEINSVEKEHRTQLLIESNSRDIESYNAKNASNTMKRLVVVIDEYADLVKAAEMLGIRKDFEARLCMLAQRVRNLGIHLVIATQRPSASIVTTALKANIPVRISFRLPAHQDSMTILDRTGAEDLLGKGDMLAMTETDYYRMQGFYISEEDLQEYLRKFKDE